jgi:hypothetical protein
MPLKIEKLENLTKYLLSRVRKPVISIGYIISFLIIALLFIGLTWFLLANYNNSCYRQEYYISLKLA